MIRVKICCISSPAEASLAISYGASALGLVGPMPSGPGIISNEMIHTIARQIPPGISSFLLTSERETEAIIDHHRQVHTNTIQLVDAVPVDAYRHIRHQLPSVKLVQVIHVIDEASVDEALAAGAHADALLLDSGNPNLAIKELGGTGRTHNWQLSRRIVEQASCPVFLAGGLHAQNVRRAMEEVQPFGLDLCSGVRTGGHLDEAKLDAFFKEVYG